MDEKPEVMSNLQWENFAKGELINFLTLNHLQKVSVDDGAQKKATVRLNSKGEVIVSYSAMEKM